MKIREIILEFALQTFEWYLKKNINNSLDYIKSRGIKEHTIKKFRLGYCPDSRKIIEILLERFNKHELIQVGLINEYNNSINLFYKNYIIFPVFSYSNNLVNLTGRRSYNDKNDIYKHLHLKGEINNLYNEYVLNLCKNYVIITESPIDCLTLRNLGYLSVSTYGTGGFKPNYINLFKDIPNVFICYDNDYNNSGIKGAYRTCRMFYDNKINPKIIKLPYNPIEKKEDINSFFNVKDKYINQRISCFEELIEESTPYDKTSDFKKYIEEKNYRNRLKTKVNSFDKKTFLNDVALINSIDISRVISNYVKLIKLGSRYRAVCCNPKHKEANASLIVFPNQNRFKCFGCHWGGDIIDFIKVTENLSYKDTIKLIKEKYA